MKVKIRGLVFAGFAAAVFAQSAMAGITPPSEQDPAHPDALKKTVVSQDYTDETYQERLKGLTDSNMYLTEDPEKGVTEEAAFIGWNYGQGGIDREWVKLRGKKQIDNTDEYIRIKHDTTNGADNHYVEFNDAAIADIANEITQAGGNNATDLQQARLTTAKAVYDFVNEELDEMGADIKGNVNYHTEKVAWLDDGFASTNQITNPVTQAQLNLNTEWKNHIDHWELIVPDARVAKTATNITTGGTSNQTDLQENLTTAKAVYDYAQPGATDENGAQVGVKNGNTSEWYTLAAGQDGRTIGSNTQDVAYTQIYRDDATGANAGHTAGVYVDLDHSRVMLASTYTGSDFQTGIANVTDNIAGAGLALATAGAVKEYVDSITHGNTLPLMPSSCQVENVHCALVSKVVTPASGNDPAVTELEWTVMAQAQ